VPGRLHETLSKTMIEDGGSRDSPAPRWAHWRWASDPGAAARRLERERRENRRRGAIQAMVGVAAATVLYWFGLTVLSAIAGTLALVVGTAALVSPTVAYAAISRGVDRFAHWVGVALTWLLLAPFYYLVVTPFSLLSGRHGRNDRLERRLDRSAATYWQRREPSAEAPDHPTDPYRRQF
jgi:hypothetical protein